MSPRVCSITPGCACRTRRWKKRSPRARRRKRSEITSRCIASLSTAWTRWTNLASRTKQPGVVSGVARDGDRGGVESEGGGTSVQARERMIRARFAEHVCGHCGEHYTPESVLVL